MRRAIVVLLLAPCACQMPSSAMPAAADPAQQVVPLAGAAADWRARLVLDNGAVGIWTVKSLPVFPQYASDEVIGLDDQGRCWILVNYSGKWTPMPILHDGQWLGGLTQGDIDPRLDGGELYTAGQKGNVYQIRSFADGGLEGRRIARLDGCEVHTLIAADLDPRCDGPELWAFTAPGALYRLTPTGENGSFAVAKIGATNGRIRDAVWLDDAGDGHGMVVTAGRQGRIEGLRIVDGAPRWELIHSADHGRGRLAVARASGREGALFYSSCDDGRVFRHARGPHGWENELIYRGPQGTRGIAAGRFAADPTQETVAVFGYSGRVELLTREVAGEPWQVETVFTDRDKGHWLAVAEYDGRNATDELLCSGYGGRIVLLARPAGYGVNDAAALREN